jgi:hypothetical protein
MPRIIVTTDLCAAHDESDVLLDEQVHSVHLSTDHAATQLVERLAWAISDAEAAERGGADRHTRPLWLPHRHALHAPPARARLMIGA